MKIFKVFFVLIILGILGFVLFSFPPVQDRLLRNIFQQMILEESLPSEDSLSAIVCGSRSPLPHPSRDGTCILVIAGDDLYVVDTGVGSANNLLQWRIPFNKIKSVLLTHLHSDHISDLPNFNLQTWINQNRSSKLTVWGPEGVETVVKGFNEAFSPDNFFRNAHHGDELAPLKVAGMKPNVINLNKPRIVQTEDLTVTAFKVKHDPVKPSLGYRFDYKGRSLVISGDTSPSQNLIDNSMGVDVLFHEAQANHILLPMKEIMIKADSIGTAKILDDITTYHTTPEEAAEIANIANVGHLVFYHLTPAPRNSTMETIFVRGVNKIRREWTLSNDGTMITLPIGSKEIKIVNID